MRESKLGFATFLILASTILSGCKSALPPPSPPTPPLASWVELASGGAISIRAITRASACPMIEIDGKPAQMAERAAPDQAFPVRACEVSAPQTAASIRLDGRALPILHREVKRIVVFGDTGCRLKGEAVQFCNDPKAWPFTRVTAAVAARHPDLVIHVGDYHYRESPCPAGVAGCAGTPSGDNWAVWNLDFFQPAAPLLDVAPWIMVRGNHELCGRGGRGWFRFLDSAEAVLDCPVIDDAFAVAIDRLSFVITDSAAADDAKAAPDYAQRYAASLAKATTAVQGPFWILTHRPVWALAPIKRPASEKVDLKPLNRTEQTAIDPEIPPNLEMVVSGHVHTFASYDFRGWRPAQLVAGMGGSLFDQMELPAGSNVEIDGMKARAFATTQYGYLVMDRTEKGWDGTLYAIEGDRVLAHCRFEGRSAACR
ncbi:MAG TPA: metallophosphoesterase [Alphaproteobacteria bacterium]|nr:metallophosphoesterase [Alphaproteobacteria bacterium]